MDIPVNGEVECEDGPCGKSTHVIVKRTTEEVTHLVVKSKARPHAEYLVPVGLVAETAPDLVQLRCTGEALAKMDPFLQTEFVEVDIPTYVPDPYIRIPRLDYEHKWLRVEHESILPGELAFRRGARVEAADGHVGQVDEFLVDPTTERITHLVLREGHLWGQKDVTVPVSEIDKIKEDTIYLKLDKRTIENLPASPVRRRGL